MKLDRFRAERREAKAVKPEPVRAPATDGINCDGCGGTGLILASEPLESAEPSDSEVDTTIAAAFGGDTFHRSKRAACPECAGTGLKLSERKAPGPPVASPVVVVEGPPSGVTAAGKSVMLKGSAPILWASLCDSSRFKPGSVPEYLHPKSPGVLANVRLRNVRVESGTLYADAVNFRPSVEGTADVVVIKKADNFVLFALELDGKHKVGKYETFHADWGDDGIVKMGEP